MKKKIIMILCVVLFILAAAAFILFRMFGAGTGAVDNEPEAPLAQESNVLIAYYSWSGNVRQLSHFQQEETGGELYRIVPEKAYGEDVFDRAKEELDNGIRPALTGSLTQEELDHYDVIYLGFPVWWYDLPMPVWTFLESYDFAGKTVIPYFSHNGSSNGAGSLRRVIELLPDSMVITENALSVRGNAVEGAKDQVAQWAQEVQTKRN